MDEMTKKLADAHGETAAANARADAESARADAAVTAQKAAEIVALNAQKDLESVQGDVAKETARADKAAADATAAIAAATAEAAALAEKTRTDAASAFEAGVVAKVALVSEAAPILTKGTTDLAKMSDRAIKLAVITHVDGDDYSDATKYDDSFVAGVYVGAVKRHARAAASRGDAAGQIAAMRAAGSEVVLAVSPQDAEKKAGEDLRARISNQSQNKTVTVTKDKE